MPDNGEDAPPASTSRASGFTGHMDPFDPKDDEDFETYLERFENWATARKIAENERNASLLSAVGKKSYGTLRSMVHPTKPANRTYEENVTSLKEYYKKANVHDI